MTVTKKCFLIFFLGFTLCCPALAADTQSVPVTAEIPQVNWIKMEDQHISLRSYIGFRPEKEQFSYSVSATGVRPRVITARLERGMPPGVRVVLEMGSPDRGTSKGPIILSMQKKVVVANIWGVYNSRGHGTIRIETDIDAPPEESVLGIKFRIEEDI